MAAEEKKRQDELKRIERELAEGTCVSGTGGEAEAKQPGPESQPGQKVGLAGRGRKRLS